MIYLKLLLPDFRSSHLLCGGREPQRPTRLLLGGPVQRRPDLPGGGGGRRGGGEGEPGRWEGHGGRKGG